MKKFIAVILSTTLLIGGVHTSYANTLTTSPADDCDTYIMLSYDNDYTHSDAINCLSGLFTEGKTFINVAELDSEKIFLDGEKYGIKVDTVDSEYQDKDTVLTFVNFEDDSKTFTITIPKESYEVNTGSNAEAVTSYNIVTDSDGSTVVATVKFTTSSNINLHKDETEVATKWGDIYIPLSLLRDLGANIYWDSKESKAYILDVPSVSPYVEGKNFTIEQLGNYILGNLDNDGTPHEEIELQTLDITTVKTYEILDILDKVRVILTDTQDDFFVGDIVSDELKLQGFENSDELIKNFAQGISDVLRDNNDDTPVQDVVWDCISKSLEGIKGLVMEYIDNLSQEDFDSMLDSMKVAVPMMQAAVAIPMVQAAGTDTAEQTDNENEETSNCKTAISKIEETFTGIDVSEINTKEEFKAYVNDLFDNIQDKGIEFKTVIKYVIDHPDEFSDDTEEDTAEVGIDLAMNE